MDELDELYAVRDASQNANATSAEDRAIYDLGIVIASAGIAITAELRKIRQTLERQE